MGEQTRVGLVSKVTVGSLVGWDREPNGEVEFVVVLGPGFLH